MKTKVNEISIKYQGKFIHKDAAEALDNVINF